MTQNPFDALGGGFDMNALLEQAQAMQEQLQRAQQQLELTQVVGSVAGDAVTVTVNGVGDLLSLTIKPGQVDGEDPDSLAELTDLIVAAWRDAKAKADDLAGNTLGPLAGGLPGGDGPGSGPVGFGLPGLG